MLKNKNKKKARLNWKKGLKLTRKNKTILAVVRWLADK
ncbi:MAG: hypothetical protein MRERV_3c115 [Mycoplasmataceae bacterium RV_VA103A]|nr:MAG: hypothetical protein MRERV_3c115 [Mycoplasmataceae bacterium RV_VA103A]